MVHGNLCKKVQDAGTVGQQQVMLVGPKPRNQETLENKTAIQTTSVIALQRTQYQKQIGS